MFFDGFDRPTHVVVKNGEVPVSDRETQNQLEQVLTALRGLAQVFVDLPLLLPQPPAVQQVAGMVAVPGVAQDATLAAVIEEMRALAGQVAASVRAISELHIEAPPLPTVVVDALAAPREIAPVTATIDDGTLLRLAAAIPKPVISTGGQMRAEVQVKNEAFDIIDPATEGTLAMIRRGISDYEVRIDYGARTDSNPTRIGKAPAGTATSATTWSIQTFTYDATNRPTRIAVSTGVWS